MDYSPNEIFSRSELLLGLDVMQRIADSRVILFGVGGVGSWCAEALVRNGVHHLTIVDSDRVATANINRQLPATTQTVGQLKVDVLKKRLLEINPEASITAIPDVYCADNADSFHLEAYNYVIDAIDSLQHKIHLLITASKTPAVVFSSMGAALKLDPLQIKVAEFWKVRGCKLASAMRQRMRKGEKPAKPILCVYSEEVGCNHGLEALELANERGSFRKAQTNGSLVHVTSVFGMNLAALVIKDIKQRATDER